MADPYISEVQYRSTTSNDFVEIAVDAGTDVAALGLTVTIYDADGTILSVNLLEDMPFVTEVDPLTGESKDVYLLTAATSSEFADNFGVGTPMGVSLSDSSGVYSFQSFAGNTVTAIGGAADGMTSTSIGTAPSGTSLETHDEGLTYFTQEDQNSGTILCLAAGTIVQTAQGGILVENLAKGMKVQTVAGDFKPLRTAIGKRISASELRKNPKLYPIRICAGAFGNNLPSRDLLVSRQHRMLVSSRIAKRMFGVDEVLVAAAKLTVLPGIYQDESVEGVEYFHLVFDVHQVIFAEGSPTESLYLGAETLKTLSSEAKEEILTLFPNVLSMNCTPDTAVLIPKGSQQKQLVARHVKNDLAVLKGFRTILSKSKPVACIDKIERNRQLDGANGAVKKLCNFGSVSP